MYVCMNVCRVLYFMNTNLSLTNRSIRHLTHTSIHNFSTRACQTVYMDEPSTGLDPASRRQLWDVIQHAKGNKSIILTTHSMEEADVLCDRIGIMAAGELQCLGVAAQLKKRYGEGFTCAVTTLQRDDAAYKRISDLVIGMFPSAKILQEPMGGTSVFEVKREEVKLSKVFADFEACKAEYGITDWGITETSLEEVFLKLAQQAHEKERQQAQA
jgi:ABC-type multidrug transport system ATPase subunit